MIFDGSFDFQPWETPARTPDSALTTLSDTWKSFTEGGEWSISEGISRYSAMEERIKMYKELGHELSPVRGIGTVATNAFGLDADLDAIVAQAEGVKDPTKHQSDDYYVNRFLEEEKKIAMKDPRVRKIADIPLEEHRIALARNSRWRGEVAWENADGMWGTSAYILGSVGGAVADPVNIAMTVPTLGIGGVAGLGGKALLRAAGINALVGAATEAGIIAATAEERSALGADITLGEAGLRMVGAAGISAGLDYLGRLGFRTVAAKMGKVPVMDNTGQYVVKYEYPKSAGRSTTDDKILDALENVADKNDLKKALRDNDADAWDRIAKQTGNDELQQVADELKDLGDAAAIAKQELPEGAPKADVKKFEEGARRHFEDPANTPPPVKVEGIAKAKGTNISDTSAGIATYLTRTRPKVDGKKIGLYKVTDESELNVDPERWQFRTEQKHQARIDAALKRNDEWDKGSAGRLVIFEDKFGKKHLVDGHYRYAWRQARKARGEETAPQVGIVFKEKDGWTEDAVKDKATQKNLQEGNVDVAELATVMKNQPELIDDSMDNEGALFTSARSVARLSDEVLGDAMAADINPVHAGAVGDALPDPGAQKKAIEKIEQHPAKDDATADDIIRATANESKPEAPTPTPAKLDDIPDEDITAALDERLGIAQPEPAKVEGKAPEAKPGDAAKEKARQQEKIESEARRDVQREDMKAREAELEEIYKLEDQIKASQKTADPFEYKPPKRLTDAKRVMDIVNEMADKNGSMTVADLYDEFKKRWPGKVQTIDHLKSRLKKAMRKGEIRVGRASLPEHFPGGAERYKISKTVYDDLGESFNQIVADPKPAASAAKSADPELPNKLREAQAKHDEAQAWRERTREQRVAERVGKATDEATIAKRTAKRAAIDEAFKAKRISEDTAKALKEIEDVEELNEAMEACLI